MREDGKSRIIYGDAPFIEDMGLLTTICLLHDEVLLFGSGTLNEEMLRYWDRQDAPPEGERSVAERMLETLLPEGVVSFYSPDVGRAELVGSGDLELPGIIAVEEAVRDGKPSFLLRTNNDQLNHLSHLLLQGMAGETMTVSSLLRHVSMLSAAWSSSLPVVGKNSHFSLRPSTSRVSEVTTFLAHRTLQRLALPELLTYEPSDILEARRAFKSELLEYRDGMRELVWLLHQKIDIDREFDDLVRHCDVLIDSKVAPAVSQLERAIKSYESRKLRRILKLTGGAALELGKSMLTGGLPTGLMGGGSALLKTADGLETRAPTMQIASFVYKVRTAKS